MKCLAGMMIALCLCVSAAMFGCGDSERQARIHAEKMATMWMSAAAVMAIAGLVLILKGQWIPPWAKEVGAWLTIAGAAGLVLLLAVSVLNSIMTFLSSVLSLVILGLIGWWLFKSMENKR